MTNSQPQFGQTRIKPTVGQGRFVSQSQNIGTYFTLFPYTVAVANIVIFSAGPGNRRLDSAEAASPTKLGGTTTTVLSNLLSLASNIRVTTRSDGIRNDPRLADRLAGWLAGQPTGHPSSHRISGHLACLILLWSPIRKHRGSYSLRVIGQNCSSFELDGGEARDRTRDNLTRSRTAQHICQQATDELVLRRNRHKSESRTRDTDLKTARSQDFF